MLAIAVPMAAGGAVIARVDGKAFQELFRDLRLPERALITLLDSRRRIIYRSQSSDSFLGSGVSGSALLIALGDRRTAVTVEKSPLDEVERVYGVARVGATDYIMTVGAPSATLYGPAQRQLARLAGFGLLALLCAVTAALFISRGIARPLDRLSLAARDFGEGNLAARAPIEGAPRLVQLGADFNAMAERIEEREKRLNELDRLKSEFVSNASHELRTPLTTIKALTRLLLRGALDEAKQREYLETIAVECDRQIDLVLNLLDLSRIEAGAFELTIGRVEAEEVLLSCLKAQSRAAEFRGHQLVTEDDNRITRDPRRPEGTTPGDLEPDRERHQVHARRRPHHACRSKGRTIKWKSASPTTGEASRRKTSPSSSISFIAAAPRPSPPTERWRPHCRNSKRCPASVSACTWRVTSSSRWAGKSASRVKSGAAAPLPFICRRGEWEERSYHERGRPRCRNDY